MANTNLKDFDDLFKTSEPKTNNANQALQLSILQPSQASI